MVGESLITEVMDSLESELFKESGFDAFILKSKVNNALREVVKARRYPIDYSEEQINHDLSHYYSNIRNIALYDYNQIGVEFQQSHNENGISRSYTDRNKLFSGVIPLAKM